MVKILQSRLFYIHEHLIANFCMTQNLQSILEALHHVLLSERITREEPWPRKCAISVLMLAIVASYQEDHDHNTDKIWSLPKAAQTLIWWVIDSKPGKQGIVMSYKWKGQRKLRVCFCCSKQLITYSAWSLPYQSSSFLPRCSNLST